MSAIEGKPEMFCSLRALPVLTRSDQTHGLGLALQ